MTSYRKIGKTMERNKPESYIPNFVHSIGEMVVGYVAEKLEALGAMLDDAQDVWEPDDDEA